ncbi:MAG: presenilin family intramembrane aspartyl protease [Candidatus Nanoarchaeia archaeon]
MVDFKSKLLAIESVLFLAVQGLALFAANQFLLRKEIAIPSAEGGFFRLLQILIAFIIAMILFILALKFLKGPISFGFFFSLILLIGMHTMLTSILPSIVAMIIAIGLLLVRWKWPNVVTHNFTIILGVAGISAYLGLNLRPWPEVILLLLGLSLYDFIAVFKTNIMLNFFKNLLKKGTPLAIIVPEKTTSLATNVQKVSAKKLKEKDKKVLMLGTGDLAFPALFVVSAYAINGVIPAIAIVIGSMFGLCGNHYLLTIKKFRFIPALPLLAFSSIIAYLIAIMI